MNDPHVESLRYRLVLTEEGYMFENPPPLDGQGPGFTWRLADDRLTIDMKDHHPSIEAARRAVKSFVRGWEISDALTLHADRQHIRLDYVDGRLIDRNPLPVVSAAPAPAGEVRLQGTAVLGLHTYVQATVVHSAYPPPATDFLFSLGVETLWHRYDGWLRGREPLPGMAYFCLTVIEALAGGGRRKACSKFQINRKVLDTLGRLTSEIGDTKPGGRPSPACGSTGPPSGIGYAPPCGPSSAASGKLRPALSRSR